MISAQHISYNIGSKQLLSDVSVTFMPGMLNLIIGPNGAGKSTLVKVICGQLAPSAGSIAYGGADISSLSLAKLAGVRAVLSQSVNIAFPLTVAEVVMMGRYPHFAVAPTERDHQACDEAMRFFDIADMAARSFNTLSGGEQQRVHFARVAAQVWYPVPGATRYLVLDEPLTYLDVHYQFHFMHKLLGLVKAGDMVVVGVVHDLNLAAKFAGNITLLHAGKVLANGTREEVLTAGNIKAAYQLQPVIHRTSTGMYLFFE